MGKVITVIELLQNQGVQSFSLAKVKAEKASGKKQADKPVEGKPDNKTKAKVDNEKIATIANRQKGKTVSVYLNSKGNFINGKSVNSVELELVIKRLGLKQAAIIVEPYVAKEKILKLEALINKAGIQDVVTSWKPKQKSKK